MRSKPFNIDDISLWASQLTKDDIKNLSDEEIISRAVENPNKPGLYGFLLKEEYFDSKKHYETTLHLLAKRLLKVENLSEKLGLT